MDRTRATIGRCVCLLMAHVRSPEHHRIVLAVSATCASVRNTWCDPLFYTERRSPVHTRIIVIFASSPLQDTVLGMSALTLPPQLDAGLFPTSSSSDDATVANADERALAFVFTSKKDLPVCALQISSSLFMSAIQSSVWTSSERFLRGCILNTNY